MTFWNIFHIFPRKQDLTSNANFLLRRQFVWNVKSYFLGKNKKNISNCPLLKCFTQHAKILAVIKILNLTLVLLNLDMPCLCNQCRSRSQLFWNCTVCHSECEFISTIWIKQSDWLTSRSGHDILIYLAWQWLISTVLLNHYVVSFFRHQTWCIWPTGFD